ncbi:MAG TPA: amidophosphoribosyltransferase [Jatrophihabitans sp.]|nr:amidophosphoribosyltransferase [Jatrophihabitans sp.]
MHPGADEIREACGVFGIWSPAQAAQPVSHMTYLGLFALQHRGQESAGIAVSDGSKIWVYRGMGLVSSIFDDHSLAALQGHIAVGHTRYSTTGSSTWANAQPVYRDTESYQFVLAHNGNLVNAGELAAGEELDLGEVDSDSDVVAGLLANELLRQLPAEDEAGRFEAALARILPRLSGAYSFVLMTETSLIGIRDPNGFRPLFLGKLDSEGGGWVLASETPALDVVGAELVREVEPGEMVVITADGVHSVRPFPAEEITPTLCVFEYVYFARPDGDLRGVNVHGARQRMGEALARQAPVAADLVIPVPESGIPGAQGFARQSGIPYADGFIKNRYIGRSFIAPTQELRQNAVRIKLNPIRANVEGKRLIVVEDSIVRATTLRETMRMLRKVGAAEIHLRVLSPPYRWPCFFGMNTTDRSQLIAATMEVDEIRDYLGADSLAYLDLTAMLTAITPRPAGFCTACLTGEYPVPVPIQLDALVGASPVS